MRQGKTDLDESHPAAPPPPTAGSVKLTQPCLQIEQFIETLFPKQDPERLAKEQEQKQRDAAGAMDWTEGAMIFGVAMVCLLLVTGIMVLIAWLFGAQFTNWLDGRVAEPLADAASSAGGAASSIGHQEL